MSLFWLLLLNLLIFTVYFRNVSRAWIKWEMGRRSYGEYRSATKIWSLRTELDVGQMGAKDYTGEVGTLPLVCSGPGETISERQWSVLLEGHCR